MDEETITQSRNGYRSTLMQVLMGVIINITVIPCGISMAFSAIALPPLKSPNNPNQLTEDQGSWFASIASLAIPIGCLVSGPILDKYGRKNSMHCGNIIQIIGWTTLAFTSDNPDIQYPQLLLGRLFSCMPTGLSSLCAAVYLSEISDPKWRGMLTAWTSIAFGIGIMSAYAMGAIWKENWKISAGISAAISVISGLLICYFMSESPTWLLSKNRFKEAEKSMITLRGFRNKNIPTDIQDEINTLICSSNVKPQIKPLNQISDTTTSEQLESFVGDDKRQRVENKKQSKVRSFFEPECLKPFLILTAFFFFQQFGGTFTIVYYAIDIVEMTGVLIDPYIVAVMMGFTRLIAAVFVSYICNRFGRRPPSIISGVGMFVSMLALAAYLYLCDYSNVNKQLMIDLNWIPVLMLIIYFFTSTIGFIAMPFAMVGEVFPTEIRGLASGVTSCLAYTFSFVVIKTYPQMVHTFDRFGVFLFYGVVSLIGTIFVIVFLPETKGKTLKEIEDYFRNGKKTNLNSSSKKSSNGSIL